VECGLTTSPQLARGEQVHRAAPPPCCSIRWSTEALTYRLDHIQQHAAGRASPVPLPWRPAAPLEEAPIRLARLNLMAGVWR
jgi:hypothetical protein